MLASTTCANFLYKMSKQGALYNSTVCGPGDSARLGACFYPVSDGGIALKWEKNKPGIQQKMLQEEQQDRETTKTYRQAHTITLFVVDVHVVMNLTISSGAIVRTASATRRSTSRRTSTRSWRDITCLSRLGVTGLLVVIAREPAAVTLPKNKSLLGEDGVLDRLVGIL